jgi:hypothetical protein
MLPQATVKYVVQMKKFVVFHMLYFISLHWLKLQRYLPEDRNVLTNFSTGSYVHFQLSDVAILSFFVVQKPAHECMCVCVCVCRRELLLLDLLRGFSLPPWCQIFALLECLASYICNQLPTFRNKISIRPWHLKMGQTGCLKMSVTRLPNVLDERRSLLNILPSRYSF